MPVCVQFREFLTFSWCADRDLFTCVRRTSFSRNNRLNSIFSPFLAIVKCAECDQHSATFRQSKFASKIENPCRFMQWRWIHRSERAKSETVQWYVLFVIPLYFGIWIMRFLRCSALFAVYRLVVNVIGRILRPVAIRRRFSCILALIRENCAFPRCSRTVCVQSHRTNPIEM